MYFYTYLQSKAQDLYKTYENIYTKLKTTALADNIDKTL